MGLGAGVCSGATYCGALTRAVIGAAGRGKTGGGGMCGNCEGVGGCVVGFGNTGCCTSVVCWVGGIGAGGVTARGGAVVSGTGFC